MKLHRVLLFTSIQMNITPVGKDLHVLLTSDNITHIGSTVYARVLPPGPDPEVMNEAEEPAPLFPDLLDFDLDLALELPDEMTDEMTAAQGDPKPADESPAAGKNLLPVEEEIAAPEAEEPALAFYSIDQTENPDSLFCRYTAGQLAKKTGKSVLCTGGIFTENPTERDISKLYENLDEMIRDYTVFYTDD